MSLGAFLLVGLVGISIFCFASGVIFQLFEDKKRFNPKIAWPIFGALLTVLFGIWVTCLIGVLCSPNKTVEFETAEIIDYDIHNLIVSYVKDGKVVVDEPISNNSIFYDDEEETHITKYRNSFWFVYDIETELHLGKEPL